MELKNASPAPLIGGRLLPMSIARVDLVSLPSSPSQCHDCPRRGMSTIVSVATASWPAELDAGHATESVLLSSSSSGRRELSIYRESDNGLLLRLVERIWSDTQTPTCHKIERF